MKDEKQQKLTVQVVVDLRRRIDVIVAGLQFRRGGYGSAAGTAGQF